MPRLSANLSIMFQEHAFIDRFAAAKRAGFDAVECWFPYEIPIPTLQKILADNALKLVGINSAPGNVAAGDWGIAIFPDRRKDFLATVDQAVEYAVALGVPCIHVLGGMMTADTWTANTTYVSSLEAALKRIEGKPVKLLIEPLNAVDRPGYIVSTSDRCAEIIKQIGHDQLRMMFDVYHVQISEGDLLRRLKRHFPLIGHIQIAGVPARNEPDEGEVNFRAIFQEIDALGWPGFVGCEYKPRTTTEAGLGWRDKLLAR
jgi:hydroxypyruvate isomerase